MLGRTFKMGQRNNNNFCTIVTSSFVHYAQTLFESLKTNGDNFDFFVLVVDDGDLSCKVSDSIKLLKLKDLEAYDKSNFNIIEKYKTDIHQNLRYGLKPVLINYLLEEIGYDKAICIDSDLFFYKPFDFLFDELNDNVVILTPHWRSSDPFVDENNFNLLLNGGLYNAGFVGASKKGIEAINWWAKACSFKLEKDLSKGLFCDQTYLTVIPLYYNDVACVIQHKGCNVSNWNMIECERGVKGEEVVINEKWPVVFVHFTGSTIKGIVRGEDALLTSHLKNYFETLNKYSPNKNSVKKVEEEVFAYKKLPVYKLKQVVKKIIKE